MVSYIKRACLLLLRMQYRGAGGGRCESSPQITAWNISLITIWILYNFDTIVAPPFYLGQQPSSAPEYDFHLQHYNSSSIWPPPWWICWELNYETRLRHRANLFKQKTTRVELPANASIMYEVQELSFICTFSHWMTDRATHLSSPPTTFVLWPRGASPTLINGGWSWCGKVLYCVQRARKDVSK